MRIYPYSGMTSAGNYVEYDWIALGRPSPGASAAALQEERTARINGDAAEATQRTTLTTQVRGNYTGTDPAQLQSGLLYQERQVRIAAEGVIATDVSSLQARMPAGNGKVAAEASVTAEASARASGDEANATRTSAIEARMPTGTDKLANEARVLAAESAAATATSAVATRLGTVESRMPAGTGALATAAAVDTVQTNVNTVDGKVTANTDSLSKLSAAIGDVVAIQNPSFETISGNIGWGTDIIGANNTLPAATAFYSASAGQGKYAIRMGADSANPNRTLYNAQQFSLRGVTRVWLSLNSQTAGAPPAGTQVRIGLRYYDVDGAYITNNYIPWFTATGGTWLWGQNLVSGWATPPATAVSARVVLYVQGLTAGVIILDDVQVNLETVTGKASADAIASVQTAVTQNGQDIAAVSTRTGVIEARLPAGTGGLATAASVDTVQANVNTVDGKVTAVTTRVGNIEARLPAGGGALTTAAAVTAVENASVSRDDALGTRTATIEARMPTGTDKLANEARVVAAETAAATATGAVATQVGQVKATADGAAASVTTLSQAIASSTSMVLVNRSFETDEAWSSNATSSQGLPADMSYVESEYAKSGARALRINYSGTVSTKTVYNTVRSGVTPGDVIRFGGFVRSIGTVPSSGGRINIGLQFRNAAGGIISGANVSATYIFTGSAFDYTQGVVAGKAVVPANAATCGMFVQSVGQNVGHVLVDDVWLEGVTALEQTLMARHTVALDVGGNISGTVNENDGVRSSYSILASVFRVVSNLTGMGMEWLDGYLRIWKGSAQLVLGHSFGSGDLVMWYGPNVGAANCTKSNGLFHLDISGGGYFGGSLSAGTLKNAVQTTTTVTTGTELINGPFDTNGNTRSVVLSFSRTMAYVSNAYGTSGFTAGAGENTATIRLYRKIGSAAETLWQTLNAAGMVDIFNEGDAPDRANSRWGGAFTVNDTSPAGQQVTYRAVITGYTSQSVSHPGTINSINTTQNLAIITTEQ